MKNYNIFISKKKPTSPGIRDTIVLKKFKNQNKNYVLKTQKSKKKKRLGRNNSGKITSYHKALLHKKIYRHIVFYRNNIKYSGIIENIEYDPNRTALIARVCNIKTKQHFYILVPQNINSGNFIFSYIYSFLKNFQYKFAIGDSAKLKKIPSNFPVFNIIKTSKKKKISGFARSAGSFCLILFKDKQKKLIKIRLPSKKIQYFKSNYIATIGKVTNLFHKLTKFGKTSRHFIKQECKSKVRGVAMNPIDHPHGGGQGKTSGGRPSVSPWAKPTKNIKQRKKFLYSLK